MGKQKILLAKHKTSKRLGIVLIAFILFTSFLLYNVFNLGFFKYEYYKARVFEQITTSSPLRAERGQILDRNMNVLAETKTSWRLFVSTKEIKSATKRDGKDYANIIAEALCNIINMEKAEVYSKITGKSVLDVTIKQSLNENQKNAVLKALQDYGLENLVFLEAQSTRNYPYGTLAAHVLGFVGNDNQGLYGLEYKYNSTLSGKNGTYLYAKDAGGNAMPGGYASYVAAEDGASIITTVDVYLQELLEVQLEAIRQNHNVTNRVSGIVMDVKSGAILAMATSSPFDPNSPFELDSVSKTKLITSGLNEGTEEYKAYKTQLMQIMWANKAVSETYEPGSTFKIVTVSAALDSGAAKITDTFSCKGYHTVGGWRIKCHKAGGHGSGFDLAYGLQMSCNPTMMTIAERVGKDTFYKYVEAFGYLEKTGIDLPSEAESIFHKADAIGSTELATLSFGQRFKVSIISQLTAIAAVANGGKLVEPYIVDSAIDPAGNVIYKHESKVKRQVISEEVASLVSDVLEAGVSGDGGAKNAYVEGYYIAAKTGTSEKFDVLDENGNSYLRIGSTVAFAKSGDKSIAMIIVVDEPQSTVKYGSYVAAPYVSYFMKDALPYLEFDSTKTTSEFTVDNYTNKSIKDTTALLKASGVSYKVIGIGEKVITQIPVAGSIITKENGTVYLYTEERKKERASIPNLCGLSVGEANLIATAAGLNVRILGVTDTSANGLTVTAQSLIPGDTVARGTVIEITVLKMDFED